MNIENNPVGVGQSCHTLNHMRSSPRLARTCAAHYDSVALEEFISVEERLRLVV